MRIHCCCNSFQLVCFWIQPTPLGSRTKAALRGKRPPLCLLLRGWSNIFSHWFDCQYSVRLRSGERPSADGRRCGVLKRLVVFLFVVFGFEKWHLIGWLVGLNTTARQHKNSECFTLSYGFIRMGQETNPSTKTNKSRDQL